MFNIITLDNPNNTAYINLKGVRHLFTDYPTFKSLTGYPFEDTVLLNYEPERNIFLVEKIGGIITNGEDLEEIVWCKNNLDQIIEQAHQNGYGNLPPTPSLQDFRNMKLYETDWMIIRHRDQQEMQIATTLSNEQYLKLLNYRQALRDITNIYSSLDDVVWPLLDL